MIAARDQMHGEVQGAQPPRTQSSTNRGGVGVNERLQQSGRRTVVVMHDLAVLLELQPPTNYLPSLLIARLA
jgi:hypothetical protein